jgi:hypothetical protein
LEVSGFGSGVGAGSRATAEGAEIICLSGASAICTGFSAGLFTCFLAAGSGFLGFFAAFSGIFFAVFLSGFGRFCFAGFVLAGLVFAAALFGLAFFGFILAMLRQESQGINTF